MGRRTANSIMGSFVSAAAIALHCSERKDSRAPMLRRTFMRGLVRQMGSPAVLAATYSNNTEQMASAAVNELQEALVRIPLPWPRLDALQRHMQLKLHAGFRIIHSPLNKCHMGRHCNSQRPPSTSKWILSVCRPTAWRS